MQTRRPLVAIAPWEGARGWRAGFTHDLELRVLYLAAQRFEEASGADRYRLHIRYAWLSSSGRMSACFSRTDRAARIDMRAAR